MVRGRYGGKKRTKKIVIFFQPGLVITENAEDTLESFCEWQEQYNPRDDNNPQHHDGASLFTRYDNSHPPGGPVVKL